MHPHDISSYMSLNNNQPARCNLFTAGNAAPPARSKKCGQGVPQKMLWSGKGYTPSFLALPQTSMRKIDDRGDTEGVGKERIENNHGQSGQ